jgi:uncharacterized integral membrane protein
MNDDKTKAEAEAVSPDAEAVPPPDRPTDQIVESKRVFAGTGVVWGLVVSILLAILLLILIAQNTHRVTVEFLGWDYSTPLIVLILAGFVIGVALDELVGLVYRARRRRTLRDRDQLERVRITAER